MKSRNVLFTALAALFVPAVFAAATPDNPPGPAGGPGTNWVKPGPGPDRPHRRLTEEQRAKLKAMTPEERHAFFRDRCEKRMQQRFDRDNNPPGPRGGPGTNWENPPGPKGGTGASPDKPLAKPLAKPLP